MPNALRTPLSTPSQATMYCALMVTRSSPERSAGLPIATLAGASPVKSLAQLLLSARTYAVTPPSVSSKLSMR